MIPDGVWSESQITVQYIDSPITLRPGSTISRTRLPWVRDITDGTRLDCRSVSKLF